MVTHKICLTVMLTRGFTDYITSIQAKVSRCKNRILKSKTIMQVCGERSLHDKHIVFTRIMRFIYL